MSEAGSGRVVLVGTPIGNLGDISPRAVEALRSADVICCEDTRRTRALLSALDIPARGRLVALHEHNEMQASQAAAEQAASGSTVAVVTDAGMPGISDPGERIVAAALAAGVVVEVIPGPVAAVTALVASGLAASRWCFEGFLPRKGAERASRLRALAAEARTTLLYEAPHRVERTVEDLRGACGGGRSIAFGRELTKKHEEFWRGDLDSALVWLRENPPRGEWVLVLDGAPEPDADAGTLSEALSAAIEAGVDRRTAVASVARSLGLPKRQVYDAALELTWPARVNPESSETEAGN